MAGLWRAKWSVVWCRVCCAVVCTERMLQVHGSMADLDHEFINRMAPHKLSPWADEHAALAEIEESLNSRRQPVPLLQSALSRSHDSHSGVPVLVAHSDIRNSACTLMLLLITSMLCAAAVGQCALCCCC